MPVTVVKANKAMNIRSKEAVADTDVLETSDSILVEHALLIDRGVRPLTLFSSISSDSLTMLKVATRLETMSIGTSAIPFVIDRSNGVAECGFAQKRWVIDVMTWLFNDVKGSNFHRVMGLLLGYSVDAIENFERQQSVRMFT